MAQNEQPSSGNIWCEPVAVIDSEEIDASQLFMLMHPVELLLCVSNGVFCLFVCMFACF